MNSLDLVCAHNLDNCFCEAILVECFTVCWTAVYLVLYWCCSP